MGHFWGRVILGLHTEIEYYYLFPAQMESSHQTHQSAVFLPSMNAWGKVGKPIGQMCRLRFPAA